MVIETKQRAPLNSINTKHPDGIMIWSCDNVFVDNCNIHDARRYGYYATLCTSSGIQNTVFEGCDWNAVLLYEGYNEFIINNEVSHSADVGISTCF